MRVLSPAPIRGPHTHVSRARSLGALMLAGGGIGWVSAALPPASHGSDLIVATYATVALVLGAILLVIRERIPEVILGCTVAFGTVLITLATREGGPQASTEDNAMLYIWVCLYAFYFFRLDHALLQTGLVGAAYALLLAGTGSFDELGTRWGVTLVTLLTAGLVIVRLRNRINGLIAELSERARHDHLTGTLNRDALEERAAIELERARREGTEVSVIALDIDRFKDFNDRFGHHVGDGVLRRVATALTRSTRAADMVARLGGDEFAVLLPGTGSGQAQAIAERLQAEVRERSIEADGTAIMVSVGIATAPAAGRTLDELWRAADLAMYEGKRAGGDGVRVAGDEPAPELMVRKNDLARTTPAHLPLIGPPYR